MAFHSLLIQWSQFYSGLGNIRKWRHLWKILMKNSCPNLFWKKLLSNLLRCVLKMQALTFIIHTYRCKFDLQKYHHHPPHTNCAIRVVYFDQHLDVVHYKPWSKSNFSIFFERFCKILMQKWGKKGKIEAYSQNTGQYKNAGQSMFSHRTNIIPTHNPRLDCNGSGCQIQLAKCNYFGNIDPNHRAIIFILTVWDKSVNFIVM